MYTLYTSDGELVDRIDMPEYKLVAFCYNQRTFDQAMANEYPEFRIERPDGTTVNWEDYHEGFETEGYTEMQERQARIPVFDPAISCQSCVSNRIISISSKSSDLNDVQIGSVNHDGYLPDDLGIGGGDYVEFDFCANCGTIRGTWPLPLTNIERGNEDD